ncbi:Restriction of telomere capping protein 5 [Venturia inaequalis]|nr:Restriction of telomere capping protein 5 [Venturia inaequalis]
MIFGSNSFAHRKSGAEPRKAEKTAAAIELKRREQEKFAPIHEERQKACSKEIMESKNRSLETIFTRDDIEALKMVQEFGSQGMIKDLGEARWAIQQHEVQLFISEYRTAWETVESQPAGAQGTDLIRLPSHSTEALMKKGFTRQQARVVQNEVTELERLKNAKRCLVDRTQQQKEFSIRPMASRKKEVESAIALGWRPEHPALLQRLQRCNDLIAGSIPEWEQEELLTEWVDAFWYSDDYEKNMEVFNNHIPEDDFLSSETMAIPEEQYYQNPFHNHFTNILNSTPDLKLRYEKLDKRRQTILRDMLQNTGIETWYDARLEAISNAKKMKRDHDILSAKTNTQNKMMGDADCAWEELEWPPERLRYINRRTKINRETAAAAAATTNTSLPTAPFKTWDTHTTTVLADKATLEIFPAPPIKCCSIACNKRKGVLNFCEHSLEGFMRGCGGGGLRERVRCEVRRFHPDRFMKCPEGVREGILKRAGEMFSMLKAVEGGLVG